jgi:hypothetical protein
MLYIILMIFHFQSEFIRGKITTSRETKELQLRINNWELGVFFPIYKKKEDYLPNRDNDKGDWFCEHSVPVPYVRPPPPYRENETPKGNIINYYLQCGDTFNKII